MSSKVGVYICTGYGIGEALDIEELSKVATSECKAAVCKTVPSCEAEDLEFIKKDIADEGLDRVVIAGPSPRFYSPGTFPEDLIIDFVNLREQVAWVQPPNDEDTQMMAADYLRMGVTKVMKTNPVEPFPESQDINKTIMVVGGGIAGITAALESAAAGYETVLIEKEANLGGWMSKLKKSIPTSAPYEELEDTGIEDRIKRIQENDKIKVYTSAAIEKIDGGPGMFDVTLKGGEAFRVGAIVQATGWKPYEPKGLDHLGYGTLKNVVTNVEIEEMAKNGGIVRRSDGKKAKNVVFVQCAGSRDKDHLSYCSSICCLNSLKQAAYVREQDDNAKAYIIYENLRAPGHYELFYKKMQQDPGVFLTKGEVTGVSENGDGSLSVEIINTLLGENIKVDADLVVLATGMVPRSADGEKIRIVHDARKFLATGEAGAQAEMAKKNLETYASHEGSEILNLNYRQGPDLPTLVYGFPDSHFICFPYETRRTGIYTAGAVRSPMDGLGSIEDATGAAFKAIQCVEMLSRGEAVIPRAGDKSFPEFFLQRCTQCKRCTEECPFGTLNEDEKGTPKPNPTRCRRCGICLGACPERIISFKNYSVDMVASMIKSIEVPEEYEEKPRVLILACENDAIPAFDTIGLRRMSYSAYVRIIPVRCLGSVNVIWINEAVAKGFDGVMLFGCKYGDDYQCHYVKGSELMNTRGDNVREKLQQMALENERVHLYQVQISDYDKIPGMISEFMEMIEEVGPNPFKDM